MASSIMPIELFIWKGKSNTGDRSTKTATVMLTQHDNAKFDSLRINIKLITKALNKTKGSMCYVFIVSLFLQTCFTGVDEQNKIKGGKL